MVSWNNWIIQACPRRRGWAVSENKQWSARSIRGGDGRREQRWAGGKRRVGAHRRLRLHFCLRSLAWSFAYSRWSYALCITSPNFQGGTKQQTSGNVAANNKVEKIDATYPLTRRNVQAADSPSGSARPGVGDTVRPSALPRGPDAPPPRPAASPRSAALTARLPRERSPRSPHRAPARPAAHLTCRARGSADPRCGRRCARE